MRRSIFVHVAAFAAVTLSSVIAQQNAADPSVQAVRSYVTAHRQEILKEFTDFLAIPNIASSLPDIEKNADALVKMAERRGLKTQLLTLEGAPPVVLAEAPGEPSRKTVFFYAHYDGQPVQRDQWKQDPWQPTLVKGADERIYARSASDDKAAVLGLLAAYDALKASGAQSSVNIKFFFEGEEEAGSPHLEQILKRYADRLNADLWVICDGPIYQNGQPLLVFGSRGVVTAQITTFGPNRPLHSGHYGNWAPNPIVELASLISRLRNTEGEILIPHYYDPVRPLTPGEKKALKELPNLDAQLKQEFQLGRSEGTRPVSEAIMKPSVNLDRIEGGGYGPNPANAVPSTATAYLDLRMVPNQTPEIVRQQLEAYLTQLGYFLVHQPPTPEERRSHSRVLQITWGSGYPPQRTDIDAPVSQAFIKAMRTATGNSLAIMPTLGGSTPAFMFEQQFGKPVIGLPIANFDNNQHAANESIRLDYLYNGITSYAAVFSNLGKYWH